MGRHITKNIDHDGIDRRGFLECMAWAGTGLIWTFAGGVARSQMMSHRGSEQGDWSFVQISDSHIGFNKEANPDVKATLETAVAKINAVPDRPELLIHTGDISHLSKPEEFAAASSILETVRTGERFFVPGEHDVLVDSGRPYRERYAKSAAGDGWYSFDHRGVHFVALVNVMNLKAGGLGSLGTEQLEWLEKDLKSRGDSTPIVVFAHVPLWTVYPDWGWGTDDGAQALSYLRRFGSVTVLNGHIHQNLQKVEGQMTFHTACSTAFPQPKPGAAAAPGPMKVPAEQLRAMLGLTTVRYVAGDRSLAVVDSSLEAANTTAEATTVQIQNVSFSPTPATVKPGTELTWINHDDMPHNVVASDRSFESPVLDTGEKFSRVFRTPGQYSYYCSLHPRMTGKLIVG